MRSFQLEYEHGANGDARSDVRCGFLCHSGAKRRIRLKTKRLIFALDERTMAKIGKYTMPGSNLWSTTTGNYLKDEPG
jgi:hypothetical protein